jgi:hypothetical protein
LSALFLAHNIVSFFASLLKFLFLNFANGKYGKLERFILSFIGLLRLVCGFAAGIMGKKILLNLDA